ncbi:MAG: PEP/pyruvate-binding domain-containing protein [Roseibacillus sp.]
MCPPRIVTAGVITLAALLAAGSLRAEDPSLQIQRGQIPGIVELMGSGSVTGSHRVEFSDGLEDWWPVHAVRDAAQWAWDWDDVVARRAGFFRLHDVVPPVIAVHGSWKNEVILPGDDFLSAPLAGTGVFAENVEVRWVKFAMIIDGLPRVYFQKSADYTFHFNFATERLSPFLGMSLEDFNGVSLTHTGQEVVLGAVLWAPERNEFGIQFVGQDEYPREMLRFLFETVEGQIDHPKDAAGFYMPTYEQSDAAERDRVYLVGHGIEVSSPERWIGGTVCYSSGWALGRLVFVEASEIDEAYASGALLPTDILLTDGVPAEVPFVAGIVTLAPTTPNSHVAILAQSYGIPFVYLREPSEQQRVMALNGREVVLRTRGYSCEQIAIFDVDGIDPVYRSEILALKEPLPLAITPMASFGGLSMQDLAPALPADIQYVGGKAANFGFLRRVIPKNSPEARAFTFDLWNAYLDQVVGGGNTLRAEIAGRLAGLTWPTNIAALDATLKGIRDLIKDEADFSPAQQGDILAALSGLDPNRKIRFRSSTNVEDSGVFVGAGLYDSFSGCLADDTDGDEVGPSHCDADQPNERGVFRALRKVYASFYNLNAFIERLRHGIDESEVGMAILVHYSFPDEIEAANGVATSRFPGGNFLYSTLVSQVGAESVTNPNGGSIPEIVELVGYRPSRNNGDIYHHQRSNRLLLGDDTVMQWQNDYQGLGDMFFDLADAYLAQFPGIGEFTLEFEYKKITDGSLVIKQVRRVPEAEGRLAPAIALVNSPTKLKVFQGEAGTLFGNHRLKSLWQMESAERWLDPVNPIGSPLAETTIQHAPDGTILTRNGIPSTWPGAINDVVVEPWGTYGRDRWNWPSEGGETTYQFQLKMPYGQGYQSDPLYALGDFDVWFLADYENPLPDLDWRGELAPTTVDVVRLIKGSPEDELPTGSILVERPFTNARRVRIKTSFYWPPHPTGPIAGYTAPLEKWVGTTITGLTTQTITLTGYFSQTYRPGHHNFTEEFLFEPGLEPGIPQSILDELQAQNIRMIYFYAGGGPSNVLRAVGFDGSIRDL